MKSDAVLRLLQILRLTTEAIETIASASMYVQGIDAAEEKATEAIKGISRNNIKQHRASAGVA